MDAWDRGEVWKDAIRKGIASYDDEFRAHLKQEELGVDFAKYELKGTVGQ